MSDTRIDFHIHFDGLGEILAHLVDRSATAKILSLLEQLMSASQSLDQQLADLTTLAQKQASDFAQFQTDVTTALANIEAGGQLTAAQQAAIDNLRTIMTTTDTNITTADAALTSGTTSTTSSGGPTTSSGSTATSGGTVTSGGTASLAMPQAARNPSDRG